VNSYTDRGPDGRYLREDDGLGDDRLVELEAIVRAALACRKAGLSDEGWRYLAEWERLSNEASGA
jgi:hypothetical protein